MEARALTNTSPSKA